MQSYHNLNKQTKQKRRRWDSNPRVQSTMDQQSIALTTRPPRLVRECFFAFINQINKCLLLSLQCLVYITLFTFICSLSYLLKRALISIVNLFIQQCFVSITQFEAYMFITYIQKALEYKEVLLTNFAKFITELNLNIKQFFSL